ncbi:MAG: FAD-binding protein [Lachnospiraceae bacterium]
MALERGKIVEGLVGILGCEQVITEEEVLKESSLDRYRKYEQVNEVYTQPIPAAVVYVKSTQQVQDVLSFANKNGINIVPRTGHSAIEGWS